MTDQWKCWLFIKAVQEFRFQLISLEGSLTLEEYKRDCIKRGKSIHGGD